jgi:hypothetical protein
MIKPSRRHHHHRTPRVRDMLIHMCGRHQVLIRVNVAPFGGNGTVSPAQGVAFATVFSLAAAGWRADGNDALPLAYR